MSFSKGIPPGKKLNELKGEFDGYRDETEVCICVYPSCRNRAIRRNEDAVFWDGVNIAKDEFESNLSPLGKLAVVANPSEYTEKYGYYHVTLAMHAECAAEWGMHLIKDALESHNIGRKLREERNNAIREQT
jgi:hypothetical protein